ncbi:hypothetical protein GCM10009861_14780 [Neomicrococcus aestuarii]
MLWWHERDIRARRCDWCGETYVPTQSTSTMPTRFCEETCAVEDQIFVTL